MSGLRDRIAEIIEEHLTCECGNWAEDMHENCVHVAEQIATDLKLSQEWAVELALAVDRIRCEPTPFPPRGELADDDVVLTRWVSGWTEAEK